MVTNKFGVMVFGVTPSPELSKLLIKRAEKGNIYPQDLILELTQKGLEHERLCEKVAPDHRRTKR